MTDTKSLDESSTIVVFCEGCNIRVEAGVVKTHRIWVPQDLPVSDRPLSSLREIEDTPHDVTEYAIAFCKRCESVFFIKSTYVVIPEPDVPELNREEQVLYPSPRQVAMEGIPSTVARIYSEAVQCFYAGHYNPSVIMSRKCLESVCKELGATKKTLKQSLEDLQRHSKIDKKLLSWADGLRLIGNDAAHDLESNFGQVDARDALDFVEAILMYVFTLDRKFEEFQNRLKDPGRSSGSNPVEPTKGE